MVRGVWHNANKINQEELEGTLEDAILIGSSSSSDSSDDDFGEPLDETTREMVQELLQDHLVKPEKSPVPEKVRLWRGKLLKYNHIQVNAVRRMPDGAEDHFPLGVVRKDTRFSVITNALPRKWNVRKDDIFFCRGKMLEHDEDSTMNSLGIKDDYLVQPVSRATIESLMKKHSSDGTPAKKLEEPSGSGLKLKTATPRKSPSKVQKPKLKGSAKKSPLEGFKARKSLTPKRSPKKGTPSRKPEEPSGSSLKLEEELQIPYDAGHDWPKASKVDDEPNDEVGDDHNDELSGDTNDELRDDHNDDNEDGSDDDSEDGSDNDSEDGSDDDSEDGSDNDSEDGSDSGEPPDLDKADVEMLQNHLIAKPKGKPIEPSGSDSKIRIAFAWKKPDGTIHSVWGKKHVLWETSFSSLRKELRRLFKVLGSDVYFCNGEVIKYKEGSTLQSVGIKDGDLIQWMSKATIKRLLGLIRIKVIKIFADGTQDGGVSFCVKKTTLFSKLIYDLPEHWGSSRRDVFTIDDSDTVISKDLYNSTLESLGLKDGDVVETYKRGDSG